MKMYMVIHGRVKDTVTIFENKYLISSKETITLCFQGCLILFLDVWPLYTVIKHFKSFYLTTGVVSDCILRKLRSVFR